MCHPRRAERGKGLHDSRGFMVSLPVRCASDGNDILASNFYAAICERCAQPVMERSA
jgi:hypothetical protein